MGRAGELVVFLYSGFVFVADILKIGEASDGRYCFTSIRMEKKERHK